MSTSRPHSSAGNKNKWAPSSSVVESRNKARELSRALERAAADLQAIDRQFQLLDSGVLSEEELKRFAGKSFFHKSPKPKPNQYIDAAETVRRRQLHEEHVLRSQLAHNDRQRTSPIRGGGSSGVVRLSPTITRGSPTTRRRGISGERLAKMDVDEEGRPRSPYAGARGGQPSSIGVSNVLVGIRDARVEDDRASKRKRSTTNRRRMRPEEEEEAAREAEKMREKQERRSISAEDKLSSAVRDRERKRIRALDQQLFIFYASRFGPMDGVLYSQASMPGVLYEKIIADGCLGVQRWWRSIWPQRAQRKKEAATFMQTMFRGKRGRKNFKNEAKAKKAMAHLFNRKAAEAFRTWTVAAKRSAGVKRLMRRVKHGYVLTTFEAWQKDTNEILDERRKLIRPVLHRILNRLLMMVFVPWKMMWEKTVKIKAMMRRSMLGSIAYCFELWSEEVAFILNERAKVNEKRKESAVEIQRTWRGYYERNGRGSRLVLKRAERDSERRAEARERARVQKQEALQAAIQQEIDRSELEFQFCEKEVLAALEIKEEENKTKVGKRRLKAAAISLIDRVEERGDGDTLTKKRALIMVKQHEEKDLRRRAARTALRTFREKNPSKQACKFCWCAFSSVAELDSHVCIMDSEINRVGGVTTEMVDDGTEGGAVVGGVDESELDAAVVEKQALPSEEEIIAAGDTQSWYTKLVKSFWKKSKKQEEKETQQEEKEEKEMRQTWEETKKRQEVEAKEEGGGDKDDRHLMVLAGTEIMEEEEQLELLSNLIAQLQMVKTSLLVADSHRAGFKIHRRLQSIDNKSKVLKEMWRENIAHLVKRYLHELDDMMYHVVATGEATHPGGGGDDDLHHHNASDSPMSRGIRQGIRAVVEKKKEKQALLAMGAGGVTSSPNYVLWTTAETNEEAERKNLELAGRRERLQKRKSLLIMPRMIHRKSFLGRERPLAHVAHTMRNVEYEVTVFGSGHNLGYRLTFVAEGGARSSKYRLDIALTKCLSVLDENDVMHIMEDALADKRVAGASGAGAGGGAAAAGRSGHTLGEADMMKVYLSIRALRMYVACLALVPLKGDETISLKNTKYVLQIARDVAIKEAERTKTDTGSERGLPIIIRRTGGGVDGGKRSLHLSVLLSGVRHTVQVTYNNMSLRFLVVNNLGREKELKCEIQQCAELLERSETEDLIRYVKARHPSLNLEKSTSMIRVLTCELALRRYVTFLALEEEEDEKEKKDASEKENENEVSSVASSVESSNMSFDILGDFSAKLVLKRSPPDKEFHEESMRAPPTTSLSQEEEGGGEEKFERDKAEEKNEEKMLITEMDADKEEMDADKEEERRRITAERLEKERLEEEERLLVAQMRHLFQLLDDDNSNFVDKIELLDGIMYRNDVVAIMQTHPKLALLLAPGTFEESFSTLDTEKDGHVTLEELLNFVHVHHDKRTKEEIEQEKLEDIKKKEKKKEKKKLNMALTQDIGLHRGENPKSVDVEVRHSTMLQRFVVHAFEPSNPNSDYTLLLSVEDAKKYIVEFDRQSFGVNDDDTSSSSSFSSSSSSPRTLDAANVMGGIMSTKELSAEIAARVRIHVEVSASRARLLPLRRAAAVSANAGVSASAAAQEAENTSDAECLFVHDDVVLRGVSGRGEVRCDQVVVLRYASERRWLFIATQSDSLPTNPPSSSTLPSMAKRNLRKYRLEIDEAECVRCLQGGGETGGGEILSKEEQLLLQLRTTNSRPVTPYVTEEQRMIGRAATDDEKDRERAREKLAKFVVERCLQLKEREVMMRGEGDTVEEMKEIRKSLDLVIPADMSRARKLEREHAERLSNEERRKRLDMIRKKNREVEIKRERVMTVLRLRKERLAEEEKHFLEITKQSDGVLVEFHGVPLRNGSGSSDDGGDGGGDTQEKNETLFDIVVRRSHTGTGRSRVSFAATFSSPSSPSTSSSPQSFLLEEDETILRRLLEQQTGRITSAIIEHATNAPEEAIGSPFVNMSSSSSSSSSARLLDSHKIIELVHDLELKKTTDGNMKLVLSGQDAVKIQATDVADEAAITIQAGVRGASVREIDVDEFIEEKSDKMAEKATEEIMEFGRTMFEDKQIEYMLLHVADNDDGQDCNGVGEEDLKE